MIFSFQTETVSEESIVYVSEPQQLAHVSEEVIDVVENPLSSTVSSPYCSVHHYYVCVELQFVYSNQSISSNKGIVFLESG